jgi:hypothetical protein
LPMLLVLHLQQGCCSWTALEGGRVGDGEHMRADAYTRTHIRTHTQTHILDTIHTALPACTLPQSIYLALCELMIHKPRDECTAPLATTLAQ